MLSMVLMKVSCVGAQPALLRTSYEEVVHRHISTIMPLFLADELTHEWNSRLKSMKFLHTREFGRLVHQEYTMPWPLAPRDLLMQCKRTTLHRETRLLSTCRSVTHDAAPSRPGVVRMELADSEWDLVALPGDRTRVKLSMAVTPEMAVGMPKFVVNYAQRSMLRDSISSIMTAVDRLQMPPHDSFISWRRDRAAVALALAQSGQGAGDWWWSAGLRAAGLSALVLALVHGGALGLLYASCRVRAKQDSDPPSRPLQCDKPQWRRTHSLASTYVASMLNRPQTGSGSPTRRSSSGTTSECGTAATGLTA